MKANFSQLFGQMRPTDSVEGQETHIYIYKKGVLMWNTSPSDGDRQCAFDGAKNRRNCAVALRVGGEGSATGGVSIPDRNLVCGDIESQSGC